MQGGTRARERPGKTGAGGRLLAHASARGVPANAIKAAVAVGAAIAVVAAVRWMPSAGGSEFVIETVDEPAASAAPDSASASAADDGEAAVDGAAEAAPAVRVHVVGAVANPGVYDMPEGARVGDVVDKAGGLLPDAEDRAVNLARKLADGEQVYIPTVAEAEAGYTPPQAAAGAGGLAAASGQQALVNINTATAEQLQELPGVGPSTAASIIAHRDEHGPFSSPEDIQNVSGIGPAKYAKISALICV